ncbi:MAG: hypothetical protein K0U41_05435 [Gammaproteobacteria bacterium]|nr:hypothetical protein [Gammaproteobacteria bacterium]
MVDKVTSNLINYGNIVSHELATHLRENLTVLNNIIPVGEVVMIMVGIPGVPLPDPNIWQECNGSEITNQNSPLRTAGAAQRYTPNMINRYIKIPTNVSDTGDLGGHNDTYSFRHNHGGRTGGHRAPEDGDPSDSAHRTATDHTHTIDFAFPNLVNVEPPYYTVKWYMRIQ